MDKKEKDCTYWVGVLLAGVALGVVAGLGLAGFAYPVYQSDKWAGWLQAVGSIVALGAVYLAAQIQAEATIKVSTESREHKKSEEIKLVLSMVNLVLLIMHKEKEHISRDKKDGRRLTEIYFISDWNQFHLNTAYLDDLINSLSPQNIGEIAFAREFLEFKGKLLYVVNRLRRNPAEKVEFFRDGLKGRKCLTESRRSEELIKSIEMLIRSISGDASELEKLGENLIKSLGVS